MCSATVIALLEDSTACQYKALRRSHRASEQIIKHLIDELCGCVCAPERIVFGGSYKRRDDRLVTRVATRHLVDPIRKLKRRWRPIEKPLVICGHSAVIVLNASVNLGRYGGRVAPSGQNGPETLRSYRVRRATQQQRIAQVKEGPAAQSPGPSLRSRLLKPREARRIAASMRAIGSCEPSVDDAACPVATSRS